MSGELRHFGIKGMKWGVRRTPEQLGHKPEGERGIQKKEGGKKASASRSGTARSMSDEELRQRINRLNMEEQYDNLLARQKQRNTGSIKKALGDAFSRFGTGLINKTMDTALDKMFSKKDEFDLDEWRDADVKGMDMDVVQKVSKWYTLAKTIEQARKELSKG